MSSTISVIIPTKNAEEFLERCVESVLAQILVPKEIIIVDNGSTDHTVKIAKQLQEKLPQLIKLSQCDTPGAGPTRQAGIEHATSKYVSFLDADDLYRPTTLYSLLAAVQKTGASCGRLIKISEKGDVVEVQKNLESKITHDMLRRENTIGMSSVMVRKSLLHRVGGFDSRIVLSEDYDLHLRITRTIPYIRSQDAVVIYRQPTIDVLGKRVIRFAYWQSVVWAKHGFFGWYQFFMSSKQAIRHVLTIPIKILLNLIMREKRPVFVPGILLRPLAALLGYFRGRKLFSMTL